MAIQQVDTSLPAGDTNKTAYTKINQNFTNAAHAASRLVGTGAGQIPLSTDVFEAGAVHKPIIAPSSYTSANDFPAGSRFYVNGDTSPLSDLPTGLGSNYFIIETIMSISYKRQVAYGHIGDFLATRIQISTTQWTPWKIAGETITTYRTTTASGANVVVDATGKLMRSTSSERYKDIIGDLTLDDNAYNNAMSLKPIVYRSTADADNPLHHYYSFSAEALGAFDKAFTFWRFTEQVEDAEGNITEQPLAEPVAEGININALLAFSHAIAIKQHKMISKQQAKIDELETRLAAIEMSLKPAK